ncbi:MAG: DUF1501 domain-containing protein [Planctomycetia bacterium]|nr:DUF1501 domain-containing protein [Planctomycetia bacterium]
MLNRRDSMIRLGQAGLGMLALPRLLRAESLATLAPPKAKNCILLYLWGGPPQQDMWDMKPDAPDGIRSEFKPIDTVVPGIQICDQMPSVARHTDKTAIIRSYTHPSNTHEVGVYHTLTGKINNTLAVPRNMRNRNDFPNMGAVVSHFSPPQVMPASVTIPRPIGHDGVIYSGTYAGFLGAQHDPMELKAPGEVNAPPPHSLEMLDGLDDGRLQARLGLLKLLEGNDRLAQRQGGLNGPQGLAQFREQAFRMLMAPEARGAFDLERESESMRDRYGRNEYGESFLLARRLIESGVRLVTVVWYYICPDGNVANVWDNHGGTGSLGGISGYAMLKEKYCLPPLDLAYSALLQDLSARGLLDETLVVMLGEFGRTPKINKAAGRDHWGLCQSVVLAGGGIRGGQVYGSSDAHAAYPKSNPVSPEDVIATTYHALGISPENLVHDREGRPHRISEGRPLVELFG